MHPSQTDCNQHAKPKKVSESHNRRPSHSHKTVPCTKKPRGEGGSLLSSLKQQANMMRIVVGPFGFEPKTYGSLQVTAPESVHQ